MAVNDVYRLSVVTNQGSGGQMIVTHHFKQNSALVFDTPVDDLIARWVDQALPVFVDLLSTSFIVDVVRAISVDNTEQGEFQVSTADGTGTQSGDSQPYQNAAVVTWRTGVPGRSNRGRNYIGGAVEANNAGAGQLTTDYKTVLNSYAQTLTFMNGDSLQFAKWQLVVYSRLLNASRPVTSYVVRPTFYTQRRRVLGVGG